MAETIDDPPFPRLTWGGYSWAGEVRLPSWAGFQSRRGAYASVSAVKMRVHRAREALRAYLTLKGVQAA